MQRVGPAGEGLVELTVDTQRSRVVPSRTKVRAIHAGLTGPGLVSGLLGDEQVRVCGWGQPADLDQLQATLADTEQARTATEAERDRDASIERADAATAERAAAEELSAAASERAQAEAERAQRAETATHAVREQLDATRRQLDQLREQTAELHRTEAATAAERDAARAEVERERAVGDQRVADLRSTYEAQLDREAAELAQSRAAAQPQRSRPDRPEAQRSEQDTATGDSHAPPGDPAPTQWISRQSQQLIPIIGPDLVEGDCRRAVALNPPIRTPPLLVVEVAGPDSTRVDEGEKVDLYGQTGLRHYWVLRWHDRLLSVYGHQVTGLSAG